MEKLLSDKFSYFMERTEDDIKTLRAENKEQFAQLNEKIDKLWTFRMLLIGGAMTVSGVTSIAIEIAFLYFGVHK